MNLFWDLVLQNGRQNLPAVFTEESMTTWSEISQLSRQNLSSKPLDALKRIGFLFRPNAKSMAALAIFDRLDIDVFLLMASMDVDQAEELASEFQLDAIVGVNDLGDELFKITPCEPAKMNRDKSSGITILTSGTTGIPKAVKHTWQSLMRPVRHVSGMSPPTWLLTYQPHLYAGIQVLLQAFVNGGAIAVPKGNADPSSIAEFMNAHQIEFVSSTPSFWRNLMLMVNRLKLASIPLQQITLGGELVDQPILDALGVLFPNARIIHMYATTELGRCFSVTDGMEGFPCSYLENTDEHSVRLKIVDDVLWVASPNAMHAYDQCVDQNAVGAMDEQGWFCTGDLVAIEGNRVRFLGRESDLINVGGNKVNPNKIEHLILELDSVADVRVYGMASTITGQLVACEFIPAAGISAEQARSELRALCAQQLDRFHQPRIIQAVEKIQLSKAGKRSRG